MCFWSVLVLSLSCRRLQHLQLADTENDYGYGLQIFVAVSEVYTAPSESEATTGSNGGAGVSFLKVAGYITHGCAVPLAVRASY